jgi:hypothetical protein
MDVKNQDRDWWRKPLRIVQTNLQVRDTNSIDPERLATQLVDLGANALVFNIGGFMLGIRRRFPFTTSMNFFLAGSI